MFKDFDKKRVIKSYITWLPRELKQRYGGTGYSRYKEAQVRKTVEELNLSSKYIEFALLIFCGDLLMQEKGYKSDTILKLKKILDKVGFRGDVGLSDNGGINIRGTSDGCDSGGVDSGGGCGDA